MLADTLLDIDEFAPRESVFISIEASKRHIESGSGINRCVEDVFVALDRSGSLVDYGFDACAAGKRLIADRCQFLGESNAGDTGEVAECARSDSHNIAGRVLFRNHEHTGEVAVESVLPFADRVSACNACVCQCFGVLDTEELFPNFVLGKPAVFVVGDINHSVIIVPFIESIFACHSRSTVFVERIEIKSCQRATSGKSLGANRCEISEFQTCEARAAFKRAFSY